MQDMHRLNVDDPAAGNWEAWAQRFMKYSQKIAENKALKKHHSQMQPSKQHNPNNQGAQNRGFKTQSPVPQADHDAMDLDRMSIARLHPTELRRRIDNDLCRRCGGEGHYAKNCDGAGNVVRDRFASRGRGGGRGRGNYQAPQPYQSPYPQYPAPYQGNHRPAQQLRATDTWYYPAPPSLTPPPTVPSPNPEAPQRQQTPTRQPGFVFGTVENMTPSQHGLFYQGEA